MLIVLVNKSLLLSVLFSLSLCFLLLTVKIIFFGVITQECSM